ncbi:hypothetical protein PR001_g20835 [Phytophthora rubi]|uniref:FAR1 domain-containing protein n=1 Tax=Phytophthora rubi TaxID=129364 RepID=A0A6A3JGI0_9STRA|nr:hypothetical protein PR001_g20835 [Phytophthora rubi]
MLAMKKKAEEEAAMAASAIKNEDEDDLMRTSSGMSGSGSDPDSAGIAPAQEIAAQSDQQVSSNDHDAEANGVDENESDSDNSDGLWSESCDESTESTSTSGSTSTSRKRAFLDCDEELFFVAVLKQYFNNWRKFEKYVNEYMRDNLVVLAVAETLNTRLRNLQIGKMRRHVDKPASELPLVREKLIPFKRVYICTHGWKQRIRSKGQRPCQDVNGTGCNMRFVAQLKQRKNGRWCVEVQLAFYGHNHPVAKPIYDSYPSVRRLPADSPIMSDLGLMIASGSKPSRVYDYIREKTPHRVEI